VPPAECYFHFRKMIREGTLAPAWGACEHYRAYLQDVPVEVEWVVLDSF